jgi:S-methylmethionine-dependent homocysteine/selenocysteine methylase
VSEPIILLDGGMGSELQLRGAEVPDHISSIWSAKALLDAPDEVLKVHHDYIEAGADVITCNNYSVTPPILSRDGLEDRFQEMTVSATELANRARDSASRKVRVAGSMPPLETSYRAHLVGDHRTILETYRRMAALLAPRVDILLCETMSDSREAVAAATAAKETDREVWLSWTLQGDNPDHLPSGETVPEAFQAAAHLDIDAYLVNCCGANFVSRVMPTLASLTDRPVGGYANPADVIPGEGDERPEPEEVERTLLDIDGYAAAAGEWIDAGARIVGGCCFTRPEHTARLRRMIDERTG